MPARLARYWDSLESAEYLELCEQKSECLPEMDDLQKQWLSEISGSVEQECQSILYAKSLLEQCESAAPVPEKMLGPQRTSVGMKKIPLPDIDEVREEVVFGRHEYITTSIRPTTDITYLKTDKILHLPVPPENE